MPADCAPSTMNSASWRRQASDRGARSVRKPGAKLTAHSVTSRVFASTAAAISSTGYMPPLIGIARTSTPNRRARLSQTYTLFACSRSAQSTTFSPGFQSIAVATMLSPSEMFFV